MQYETENMFGKWCEWHEQRANECTECQQMVDDYFDGLREDIELFGP